MEKKTKKKKNAQNDWYRQLVSDLKRLAFGTVRINHAIGKRILKDELKFGKSEYGSKRIENLANDMDVSWSHLYKCIQFAKKYPKIVTALQNVSWRHIVNKLLPESPRAIPADDKIPDVVKKRTRLGDLWVLGTHRLLCGDATSIADVKWLLYGQHADICITSPPYNLGEKTQSGKKRYLNNKDNKTDEDYLSFLIDFTALALLACQYVFVNLQQLAANNMAITEYMHACKDYFAERLVWNKITAVPARAPNVCNSQFEDIFCFSKRDKKSRSIGTRPFEGTLSNLISIDSRQDKEFSSMHRATFPIEFASYFVDNFVADFAERIVYEPFAGTGTTLIACENLDRRCYAMEIDPNYCDIIIQRWEDHTDERALLCERDGLLWKPDGSIWQRQYTI